MEIDYYKSSKTLYRLLKHRVDMDSFSGSVAIADGSGFVLTKNDNHILIPTKRFRIYGPGAFYHERMNQGGLAYAKSGDFYRANNTHFFSHLSPQGGQGPGFNYSCSFSESTDVVIPSTGNRIIRESFESLTIEDDSFASAFRPYAYIEGLTDVIVGPTVFGSRYSPETLLDSIIIANGGHGVPIVTTVEMIEFGGNVPPSPRHSNSVAYGKSLSGAMYVTSNHGVFATSFDHDRMAAITVKYDCPMLPCVNPDPNGPPHTDHPMFMGPPPIRQVGTVTASMADFTALSPVYPINLEPVGGTGMLSMGSVGVVKTSGGSVADRYLGSDETPFADGFVVDRYEIVDAKQKKVHMRWTKPTGDDEYPQYVLDQNIYNARDKDGNWTARAQCYEASPGKIVIGHWTNRLGKRRKAVYDEASNTITKEDADLGWFEKNFFHHKVDGNWLQRFSDGAETWTVMFPGWDAAVDATPWIDPMAKWSDSNQKIYKDRAWDMMKGNAVPADGYGAPWLILWRGHDVNAAPEMAFNMGWLYMIEIDYVHRVDSTGFFVKGTAISGVENTTVRSESNQIWNNVPPGIPIVRKEAKWALPVKGGVGMKCGVLVDVRHLFANDPARELEVPALGRMFPIRIDMQKLVSVPYADNPNKYLTKFVNVNLRIDSPGLYSVNVSDDDMTMDGQRGDFWMRLYKGTSVVMPDPRFDPPKQDGSSYRQFAWIRGGRFRVKPGEEGVYRLQIAVRMNAPKHTLLSYSNIQSGNAGALSPFWNINPSNPDFSLYAEGVLGAGEELRGMGDIIIPLQFGVAQ